MKNSADIEYNRLNEDESSIVSGGDNNDVRWGAAGLAAGAVIGYEVGKRGQAAPSKTEMPTPQTVMGYPVNPNTLPHDLRGKHV